jgi:hypothetical protein
MRYQGSDIFFPAQGSGYRIISRFSVLRRLTRERPPSCEAGDRSGHVDAGLIRTSIFVAKVNSPGVNKSHGAPVILRLARPAPERKVPPTRNPPEETTMNKILAALTIVTALSATCAFAEDRFQVSMENGKPRIDFSLNGNGHCVILNDKVTCEPMPAVPVKVASSATN